MKDYQDSFLPPIMQHQPHKSSIIANDGDMGAIPIDAISITQSHTHRQNQFDKNSKHQRNLGILSPFSASVEKVGDKRQAAVSVANLIKVQTPFDQHSKAAKATGTSLERHVDDSTRELMIEENPTNVNSQVLLSGRDELNTLKLLG